VGQAKQYRSRLKYQVSSAKAKTLQALLASQFRDELAMSETESRLLSYSIADFILSLDTLRGPNQIICAASYGAGSFARRYNTSKNIKLTIYDAEDLDIQLEFGLAAMQQARIMRLVEEAYNQDSLLSAKQLTVLVNITPTSLRERLKNLRQLGLWVPVKGLGKKDRDNGAKFRSTWAIEKYNQKMPPAEIRKTLAMSKERFESIMSSFTHLLDSSKRGLFKPNREELSQWLLVKNKLSKKTGNFFTVSLKQSKDKTSWEDFSTYLVQDFSLSPIKLRAIKQITDEIVSDVSAPRDNGDIIYWAVSASTPAGVPLSAAKLVPVVLTLYDEQDVSCLTTDKDINRLSAIKFKKILRISTQAKVSGAYLTHADLSYLLGIHCSAISNILKANPGVVVPLRGAECDIGRGITHRKEIIKLYLDMHTETEIVSRTGHSYESVENYIKEFAAVLALSERGLPIPLIRRVTGRSIKLISTYMDLIDKYSEPQYAFRFAHLRKIFETHDFKKKDFQIKL